MSMGIASSRKSQPHLFAFRVEGLTVPVSNSPSHAEFLVSSNPGAEPRRLTLSSVVVPSIRDVDEVKKWVNTDFVNDFFGTAKPAPGAHRVWHYSQAVGWRWDETKFAASGCLAGRSNDVDCPLVDGGFLKHKIKLEERMAGGVPIVVHMGLQPSRCSFSLSTRIRNIRGPGTRSPPTCLPSLSPPPPPPLRTPRPALPHRP